MGGKVETKWVCHTCALYIRGPEVTMDLVLLDISSFDVIVGTDWLAQHHAVLDCYLKKVTFQTSSGSYLSFYGDRRLTFIPLIQNLDDKWSRKDGGHYFLFNMQGEGKRRQLYIAFQWFVNLLMFFRKNCHFYLLTERWIFLWNCIQVWIQYQ